MATPINPYNLQKLEYNVNTPEGAAAVTVVTGMMEIGLQAGQDGARSSASFKALLDPLVAAGKFRKATATASIASCVLGGNGQWVIDEAEATLDDESGRVKLTVDVTIVGAGSMIERINFQVTTLAMT
jgi:hypothetical protein